MSVVNELVKQQLIETLSLSVFGSSLFATLLLLDPKLKNEHNYITAFGYVGYVHGIYSYCIESDIVVNEEIINQVELNKMLVDMIDG